VLRLDHATLLAPGSNWLPLDTVQLGSTSQLYFDVAALLPASRLYRVSQVTPVSVGPGLTVVGMVPAITLTGSIGSSIRIDAIKQIGPPDAWFTLDTVTLSNSPQLYLDPSSLNQPTRLYRLTQPP
jgi:hypothetical protein